MRDVETLIIGAGISGLATAASLGRGADVVVLEARRGDRRLLQDGEEGRLRLGLLGPLLPLQAPRDRGLAPRAHAGAAISARSRRSRSSTYAGTWVDFPFQKNIHQLPQDEFIDCLYDLYFAPRPGHGARRAEGNFKEMLYARFGRSIAEKFLIPYNEKLYATDLATLDNDAMGRFFPHADLTDIIRNMKAARQRDRTTRRSRTPRAAPSST